jgi:hypothetical protein
MIPEFTHNLSSNTHFRFSLLNFRIVSLSIVSVDSNASHSVGQGQKQTILSTRLCQAVRLYHYHK